jgi:ATP-dependent Clp protease ATP-binding subunit ClpA
MFERFTGEARNVVVHAQVEARALRHTYIGSEHLLLALIAAPQSLAGSVLSDFGFDLHDTRRAIAGMIGSGPVTEPDERALGAIGIDLDEVRRRAEDAFGPGALERARVGARSRSRLGWLRRRREPEPAAGGHIPFTPAAKLALEMSLREALGLGHNYIGTEHILLALAREKDGIAARLLGRGGLGYDAVREAVTRNFPA